MSVDLRARCTWSRMLGIYTTDSSPVLLRPCGSCHWGTSDSDSSRTKDQQLGHALYEPYKHIGLL